MNPRKFLLLWSIVLISIQLSSQTQYKTVSKTSADGKYSYEVVEGDPTQTRFYVLKNGLRVILSENKEEPTIMALLTTRAGGKNDPADNTGLAHYLEHMLFKGTSNLGTTDYAAEKVHLDEIERLYEVYNVTTDEGERKRIYRSIDSVSALASKYAIPNEYDKAMSAAGSSWTNAFTSFEMTAYMENVPSNNLEKYLIIQNDRFQNPVFRLFHTELETVYEEKNISLDNGSSKVFEGIFSGLFKNHPYGTQTILGDVEHLKNPSLKAIRKFYDTYYVPNNMALILVGDLNPDEAIILVDKYLGQWKPGVIPEFSFKPEEAIKEPIEKTVVSPDEESVAIGYRMPDTNDKEALLAEITSTILYNGKTGLIDKNLVIDKKVLSAYGFDYLLTDYGLMYFGGRPLENQSLTDVKDLIIGQINDLKAGNFEEDMIQAIINNQRVSNIRELESGIQMAFTLNQLFSTNTSWEDYLRRSNEMSKVTKKDIVDFANKWFGENYVVVYKLTGEDPDIQKVVKPEITPIDINRESTSAFLKMLNDMETTPPAPVFLDYSTDISFGAIHKDVPVWAVKNETNNLFTLYYVLDMGSKHNKKLPLAIEYLKMIGSEKMSNEQINKELYKLAVDFNIFSSADQVYVSLSGLQENLEDALVIINDLIRNAKADQNALNKMVDAKIKERNDATLNKRTIFWAALNNYVDYGSDNPYKNILSNSELRNLKAEELTSIIHSLPDYKHKIYYYGPDNTETIQEVVKRHHPLKPRLKDYPEEKDFPKLETDGNTIYFVDYDMVQVEIGMQRWDDPFDPSRMPMVRAFGEYYGGSMASVVFQEIREARALAYSTFGYYSRPPKKEDRFKAGFYVGTQSDKLGEAFDAMYDLLNNFKRSESNWEISKKAIKQEIESERITKSSKLFNYQTAQKLGYDYDMRKDIYDNIDNISLNDVEKFHSEHMKNKDWNIRIIGSKEKLDMDLMAKYGKVIELDLKEAFGYEVEQKDSKP
jgi:predicted Zn-dependent peptidase